MSPDVTALRSWFARRKRERTVDEAAFPRRVGYANAVMLGWRPHPRDEELLRELDADPYLADLAERGR